MANGESAGLFKNDAGDSTSIPQCRHGSLDARDSNLMAQACHAGPGDQMEGEKQTRPGSRLETSRNWTAGYKSEDDAKCTNGDIPEESTAAHGCPRPYQPNLPCQRGQQGRIRSRPKGVSQAFCAEVSVRSGKGGGRNQAG